MTDPIEPHDREDDELVRFAEAIADAAPHSPLGEGDRATSPQMRRMDLIAEAAEAFRGVGSVPPASGGHLFTWGSLEVRRMLGEGSFGDVYAAWDPRLRREVALKLRRADAPGSARRWLDEARALAAVRHPNVLTVYGADEYDGRAGLWTDLVLGRDLETILQQHGPFSPREAVSIGLELCAALAAVHALGLVHGDIKTRNVMREEGGESSGRIVLMDFGSAHESSLAVTAGRGASIGTPLAMAPEVLRGEAATPASDLYSLGVLLFRLVTGRYPIEAETLDELRRRHDRREVASLRSLRPELPRAFVQNLERVMDADPSRRFADAAQMERALQAPLAPAPANSLRPVWAMALVLVALGAAAWLWRVRSHPPANPTTDRAASQATSLAPNAQMPNAPPAAQASRLPARGALQVVTTLYRGRGGEVSALLNGGEVEPGDRLWLDLESPERVHVYVLDEDRTGATFLLFPVAASETKNPLSAAIPHELPGPQHGEALRWQVTSAGGRETFLVVASRQPIASIQRVAAMARPAAEGASVEYARISPDQLADLRGVGGVIRDSTHVQARPSRLSALARALEQGPRHPGLWVRLLEVQNPAR